MMEEKSFEEYTRLRKELIIEKSFSMIIDKFEGWKMFPPASESQFQRVESSLNISIPSELKNLYLETDGVTGGYSRLVLPVKDMLKINKEYREGEDFAELYMTFENMLIFGEAPNGDLFAYPIKKNGMIDGFDIFAWDHETDSRVWVE